MIGVYDKVEEIDWSTLPNAFVIKCNHGCGFNIICTDKGKLNIEETIKQLQNWMKTDYWKKYGEIQYKYIKKRIIIESYLGEIETYKFYCFNGEPKVLYISSNGEDGEKDKYIDYFDMEWNHLDIQLEGHQFCKDNTKLKKPISFEQMKTWAKVLSSEFPFVRVDLYDVSEKVYFSELTFIPTGGYMKLIPRDALLAWGSWLKL